MSGQKYKLQSVLDVREAAKSEAARALAARRAALGEAEAELARRQGDLARCRARQLEAQERMLREWGGGARAHDVASHRGHLADLREREQQLLAAVAQQQTAVARAEAEVEAAVAKLTEAAREVRIIQKHRENWDAERRREGERREQRAGDESAAAVHRRNSSD